MKFIKTIISLLITVFVLCVLSVVLFRFVAPPTTIGIIHKKLSTEEKVRYDWVDFPMIQESLKLALQASVELRNRELPNRDLSSFIDQLSPDLMVMDNRPLHQRVAENVYLWKSESGFIRFFEQFFGGLIYVFWSDERIAEVYLNTVYFGEGMFGVQAAGYHYFRKDADEINFQQAALMIAALPEPDRLSISNPSPILRARQAFISLKMAELSRD